LTRWQKKDQSIASLTDQKAALSKQLEESSKVSKELDEERASMNQLKEQHSLELAKQKTKLEDACKHYQNTLKDEQGKLQLKEEELGAANSEISRIKSEVAAKTEAVEAQKVLVMELQEKICGLEEDLTSEQIKSEAAHGLAAQVHALTRDVRSGFELLQRCREQRALLHRNI
jgi:chromosome segregation ATPase